MSLPPFVRPVRRRGRWASGLLVSALLLGPATSAGAAPAEPQIAEQNALVKRHCAVCHTDAARNGGLTLQHFDATTAAPSLAAMMLSKLTSGVPLATLRVAATDTGASALVTKRLFGGGAIFAAGIAPPPVATLQGLAAAFTARAATATGWHTQTLDAPTGAGAVLVASTLRELTSTREADTAAHYRLVVTCDTASREGGIQLAWAPSPKAGSLSVRTDGGAPHEFRVEGSERMGNGTKGNPVGPAALTFSGPVARRLPAKSLVASGLFPGETVEFSFGDLPAGTRRALQACFPEATAPL